MAMQVQKHKTCMVASQCMFYHFGVMVRKGQPAPEYLKRRQYYQKPDQQNYHSGEVTPKPGYFQNLCYILNMAKLVELKTNLCLIYISGRLSKLFQKYFYNGLILVSLLKVLQLPKNLYNVHSTSKLCYKQMYNVQHQEEAKPIPPRKVPSFHDLQHYHVVLTTFSTFLPLKYY